MKLIKKYQYILKFIIFILIFTAFLTIINLLFNTNNITHIISLIIMIIYFLIKGYKLGQNTDNKAYKVGLIRGLIYILIMYIMGGIVSSFAFNLRKLIYYLILLTSIILGSIIGINKKKNK